MPTYPFDRKSFWIDSVKSPLEQVNITLKPEGFESGQKLDDLVLNIIEDVLGIEKIKPGDNLNSLIRYISLKLNDNH